MINQEIAKILYEIADMLEIKEIQWEPQAYRKAARNIESSSKDLEDIYKKGDLKALDEIPGVGESISEHIEEYIKKGKITKYEKLKKQVPKGVRQMLNVPSLGPKTVKKLYKKKITSIKQLEQAAKKGKLESMPGFKKKKEENILEGVKLAKSRKRFLLYEADQIAQEIIQELKKEPSVKRIDIAGSLRRMKDTIGDLDILVISKKPEKIIGKFTSLPQKKKVLAKGNTKSVILLKNDMQVDLRVIKPKGYSAALNYFIGSKDHNIAMRKIAIKKGYKLSEYGLFTRKGNKQIPLKTEAALYKKLGMKFIEPELREMQGELEAAKKKLPKLINYNDIKGDLQMHTKWSDGTHSALDMIKACKALGYQYIAITDHSEATKIAKGIQSRKLSSYLKDIKKASSKVKGINVFLSSEVEIMKDGSLDYDDKYLKKLDFTLAAIHSNFKQSKTPMTKRIIKAIENKHIKILAHPTTRKFGSRKEIDADWDKIFKAAKENNVYLEINSQPKRMDLPDYLAKKALEAGCKLSTNTDAHNPDQLKMMKYGVATAKRAWAKKSDILNTKSYKEIKKILKK